MTSSADTNLNQQDTYERIAAAIASLAKTQERLMGGGQLMMPLFFASNAIYPLAVLPDWLQIMADANPLTYLVDVLRGLMLQIPSNTYPLGLDLGIWLVITGILTVICGRLYLRLVG